ncbi:hypothetical protein A2154_03600 [Candidatus Gottesmanbacteria bacterium RBG_16_43_7]|uniref:Membrane protein 6-pyruvoyl-tetrahydropterin synthase-related domain-containing protein n=1 Tax=Candidatus Gottesmanbacteria bacterium RBG_16_43_7 TaxID=1798373 RepID=A0A1F5Z884_9BACT|nr:MAG: hypothetical protein A2154_03600 [Candidatus Gottesmanbacteria bacterium RBG_16_43_7]
MKRRQLQLWQFLCVVILVLLLGTVLLPLFLPGFPITDDGDWMIIRLTSFYQNFREGQFPVRYLARLNYHYGYPVANFLYPGFLYIGSIIHAAGLSFVNSVKLILISSVIALTLFTYRWLRTFFPPITSQVAVIQSILSPYLLFDIYKRGSVGEVLAIAVSSVCLYLLEAEMVYLLPFAMALLIVSHNSLALVFGVILCMYALVRNKVRLIPWMLLGGLISAFFWVPAIFESRFVIFNNIRVSNPFLYFAYLPQLQLLSVSIILSLVVGIFIRPKRVARATNYFVFVVCAVSIFLVIPISAPFWTFDTVARIFQFPYRFLAPTVIFGSWMVANVIDNSQKRYRLLWVAIFTVTSIYQAVFWLNRTETVIKTEGFYTTNEATTTVANEYMPKWIKAFPSQRAEREIELIKGSGAIIIHKSNSQKYNFTVNANEEAVVRINAMYYPGWGVSDNGQPKKIDFDNDFGLITFPISGGSHHIQAEFRETVFRFIIDTLSALAFIGALVLALNAFKSKLKLHK